MTPGAQDHLAEIARAVGYHDGAGWPDDHGDDDCPVDSLIAYKDALEDEVGRVIAIVQQAQRDLEGGGDAATRAYKTLGGILPGVGMAAS